jgi:hypothetical protein
MTRPPDHPANVINGSWREGSLPRAANQQTCPKELQATVHAPGIGPVAFASPSPSGEEGLFHAYGPGDPRTPQFSDRIDEASPIGGALLHATDRQGKIAA